MKKFFFALLISAPVFAGELVIMDIPARDLRGANDVDTRFVVNEAAGTVAAELRAFRTEVNCIGGGWYGGGYGRGPWGGPYHRNCMTYQRETLNQTEEIPGMTVVDKVVSLDGVVCGKMGLSRVLHIPTFFTNGKCKLVERMVKVEGERERHLQVKVITK